MLECRHLSIPILQQPFATQHLNYNRRTSPCLLFRYTSASRSHARVTTGQLNPDTDITLRWLWLRGPLALVTTLFEKERCRLIPTWTGAWDTKEIRRGPDYHRYISSKPATATNQYKRSLLVGDRGASMSIHFNSAPVIRYAWSFISPPSVRHWCLVLTRQDILSAVFTTTQSIPSSISYFFKCYVKKYLTLPDKK